MNDIFVVKGLSGARALSGTVRVSGSKNAVLPALASAIIFRDSVRLANVPMIEDVRRMMELLSALGASVSTPRRGTLVIDPARIRTTVLSKDISARFRASIILSGPALARFKKVSFPHPGGCVIGERPIDIFLEGFAQMGARVVSRRGGYHLSAPRGLSGARIFCKIQSVTVTETFMMAAVLARGVTVIDNAALEPEILHLARFLNRCGAHIEGAGTPRVVIRGSGLLRARGKAFVTPPDRIEAGSYLILGALAAKRLTVTNCDPGELDALLAELSRAGIRWHVAKHTVTVFGTPRLRPLSVKTHEYPGFPTDLQAPLAVLLTQADGESRIFETIFEGRLNYMQDLVKMGAHITVWNAREATLKGPRILRGRELYGPDIRAGLAFVIAAIIARGTSRIHNVYFIDRGYERIEEKLKKIGVAVERVPLS